MYSINCSKSHSVSKISAYKYSIITLAGYYYDLCKTIHKYKGLTYYNRIKELKRLCKEYSSDLIEFHSNHNMPPVTIKDLLRIKAYP